MTDEVVEEVVEDVKDELIEDVEDQSRLDDRANMKTRMMDGEPDVIDVSARTVRVAISSETPVDRGFGNEILDHADKKHRPGVCSIWTHAPAA